jgi:hypothetical protein
LHAGIGQAIQPVIEIREEGVDGVEQSGSQIQDRP